MIGNAINCVMDSVESLIAFYQDFMESSKIVYFFKYYLQPGQKPGTIALLGCGFVGLWGYGRMRMKK